MESWNDMMERLVSEDYDGLLRIAREAMADALTDIKRLYPNEYGKVLYLILSSALAADGDLSVPEKRFISDLLHLPEHTVSSIIAGYSPASDEFVTHLVNYLPPQQRQKLILLIACVAVCDKTISRGENAFLKGLMAE